MSYASDDLAPLLFPPIRGDFGFHQGKVVTWNQETGQNTILMAGATLVDVPILNGTEVPLLEPDHIVGMLRWKSSYFIMGRIIIPNTPGIGALPGMLQGAGATEINFSVSTSRVAKATAVFTVPAWANQASVMAVSNATVFNTSGTPEFIYNVATISGGWGGEPFTLAPNGGYGYVGSSSQFLFGEGAETGLGSTVTVTSTIRASASLSAAGSNITNIHAIAIFRKA